MNTTHTPGPWVSTTWDESRGNIKAVDQPFQPVVAVLAHDNPNTVADGHLIAAAPDLLAAAVIAVALMENAGISFNETGLRAAISKAEGK